MTRVAGVRLDPQRAVWVDAGIHRVSLLDEVVVTLPEGDVSGSVFVTPEQLLNAPERVDGRIEEVRARPVTEEPCSDLPGSDMPYLGSQIELPGSRGVLISVNQGKRTATVRHEDGSSVELALSDVPGIGGTG